MNELQLFNSPEFGEIRVSIDADGAPMFCLSDVCRTLGLTPSKVAQRLSEGVLSKHTLATPGGEQVFNFVNEDGLYDAILDSRKKKAKMFRKWITSEVLPSIRKTGGYMVTNQEDTPELIMARAVMMAQATIQRYEEQKRALEAANKEQNRVIEKQGQQIVEMKPKADFYDTIMGTSKTIEMKDVAKVLNMGIGRNNLFKFLREHKIVDKRNVPYQEYVNRHWFKSVPVYFDDPRTGLPSVYLKTVVFPVGIDGIRQLLNSKGYKKNTYWEQGDNL